MPKIVFVDIDTQYDFISPFGRLYVPGSCRIVANLKKLTRLADKHKIPIVSSLDEHAKDDPEFQQFPAHCLQNSRGAQKISQTKARKTRQILLKKCTFDVFSHKKANRIFKRFDTAYVYGVALDYCVKAACLGLLRRGIKTYLVRDATQAVTRKTGQETLSLLKSKGIKFIKTKQLLESR